MSTINADKLKEYIIENNCVEQILESLECHSIKEYPKEWRAALPNGINKTDGICKEGYIIYCNSKFRSKCTWRYLYACYDVKKYVFWSSE